MNTYLNMNGEIESLTYKEIEAKTEKSISWDEICNINKYKIETVGDQYIYHFIKCYIGKVCVTHYNCAKEWGYIFLNPNLIKLVLKNGAIDKRGKK